MYGKFRIFLFFTAVSYFSIGASWAADITFTISGTVRDAKTSEPVPGAVVFIKDIYKGSAADVNGNYSITGVPAGKQTLVFSLVSYRGEEMEIDVQGDMTGLDVRLEEEVTELGEVTVRVRRSSNTENAMVGTVRMAPQITNGISAAQIAKSPDRTASEVVKRVPGITIIDDRFIIVRGLSQRYNNAWINGLAVPSTETDSRAFSFDLIPGSQIDNLLVYKSPSPEVPGDFSGGFVKITTKSIPDENRVEIGYQTGFNVKTRFSDFRINPGSGTDFLGFDAGKRPLSGSFPAHLGNVTDPAELTRLTRTGFNNDWRIKNSTPLPDQRLTLMVARRFETENGKTIGNITAVNYSNTFKTIEDIKNARYGIWSVDTDSPVHWNNYADNQYSNEVRTGAMHNWSFVPNSSNRIEFRNLFNLLGRNRLTERTGTSETSGIYYQKQTEMLYSSRLTYTGQFSGTHDLERGGTFGWDAGYSYANRNEPDRRIAVYQAGIGSLADIPSVELRNDNIKRYFQTLDDHIVSAAANHKQPLHIGKFRPTLKTGLYGEFRTREYTPREFIYRYDKLSYDQRQAYLLLPFQEMLQEQYLGADKVYIDEITRKTDAYSAKVYYGAAYGALDIPAGDLNIYAGVRLESHTTELTYDRTNAGDQRLMTTRTVQELNLLPSINLTYKFNDKHQARAAYGRSVNRPELRELSPAVYYDFDLFSEIGGNPDLKTALVDNLDLRYEFYPENGETVSIGAFYKHFRNPIEWTFVDMGGTLRYMYENADRAVSWGFELDVRKKLDFLSLRNFSLVLNAAWIESNVTFRPGEVVSEPDRPMQGQSPYIVNAGLYYSSEKAGFDMALLYNRIGKRIVGLGKSNSINPDPNTLIPDSYEIPRNSLDFTVSKKISQRVELRASVKDIFSEDVVYKQFPHFVKDGVAHERQQVTRRYNPSQSVSAGLSVKF
ncbi:MAG: TonB-dependent receptor [Rikenellaceae bacterium]|jgi:outer membrane receptor protein involved in Fe transport|nr:TonB-dependent receptor [Rikenellaceae bacterium]